MTAKTKHIRVSFRFGKMIDGELVSRVESIVNGMTNSPSFSKPPVDLAALKTLLTSFSAALTAALDGGKKAIAEKNHLRGEILKQVKLLGHYVELVSNNDITTLLSSGFEPLIPTRSAPQPLAAASIKKIDYGNSGQLLVSLNHVAKASSYEVRYSAMNAGGGPGPWSSVSVAKSGTSVPCNGLNPGTVYAFQVRALGHIGFTDWSDTVTKMCT